MTLKELIKADRQATQNKSLFNKSFLAVLIYRIEHKYCKSKLRYLFKAPFYLAKGFLNSEISPEAIIGPGFSLCHTASGIVISKNAIIGSNFRCIGGNCIGVKFAKAKIIIGDNLLMGMGARIMGPCNIGNNVKIGMSSVAWGDIEDNTIIVKFNKQTRKKILKRRK